MEYYIPAEMVPLTARLSGTVFINGIEYIDPLNVSEKFLKEKIWGGGNRLLRAIAPLAILAPAIIGPGGMVSYATTGAGASSLDLIGVTTTPTEVAASTTGPGFLESIGTAPVGKVLGVGAEAIKTGAAATGVLTAAQSLTKRPKKQYQIPEPVYAGDQGFNSGNIFIGLGVLLVVFLVVSNRG